MGSVGNMKEGRVGPPSDQIAHPFWGGHATNCNPLFSFWGAPGGRNGCRWPGARRPEGLDHWAERPGSH